ncbi:MAG: hypothetical protein C5B54_04635 [Acidobacteria bacterium]|nr:MAG: hypothetical protein C5B54_04635 [Acidobacteriota bacterium]
MKSTISIPKSSPIIPAIASLAVGILAGMIALKLGKPLLIVGAMMGIVLAIASVSRIEWALGVFAFVIYTALSDVLASSHNLPPIVWPLVGLLLLAALLRWILFNQQEEPAPLHNSLRPILYLASYVVLCVASLMWSADMTNNLVELSRMSQGVIIVTTVLIIMKNESAYLKVLWGLLFAGIFLGSIGVYQFFTKTFSNTYWGFAVSKMRMITMHVHNYRLTGPLGDPNFFGQIMVVLIPMAAERFWNERRVVMKAIAAWAAVVCALAVVFTYSRGAFLTGVFMGGMLLMRVKHRFVYIAAAIVLALIAIPLLPEQYTQRMMTIIPGMDTDQAPDAAVRGRESELKCGLLMLADHPLLGVGYGNYPYYYQHYAQRVGLDARLADRSAHNLYMETAAEGGMLGLVLFGSLLGWMVLGVRRCIKYLKETRQLARASLISGFYFGIIGYLVSAIFLHISYPRFFWLLIGVGLAIPRAFTKPNDIVVEDLKTNAEPLTDIR